MTFGWPLSLIASLIVIPMLTLGRVGWVQESIVKPGANSQSSKESLDNEFDDESFDDLFHGASSDWPAFRRDIRRSDISPS